MNCCNRPGASVILKVWDSAFALSDLWGTSWSGSQSEGSDAILCQRSRCSGASLPYLRALSIPSLCAWYSVRCIQVLCKSPFPTAEDKTIKMGNKICSRRDGSLAQTQFFTPMKKSGYISHIIKSWSYRMWNIHEYSDCKLLTRRKRNTTRVQGC